MIIAENGPCFSFTGHTTADKDVQCEKFHYQMAAAQDDGKISENSVRQQFESPLDKNEMKT